MPFLTEFFNGTVLDLLCQKSAHKTHKIEGLFLFLNSDTKHLIEEVFLNNHVYYQRYYQHSGISGAFS